MLTRPDTAFSYQQKYSVFNSCGVCLSQLVVLHRISERALSGVTVWELRSFLFLFALTARRSILIRAKYYYL